ncbi:Gfo/Idh/MocA family oxidoreductase [Paenibacillus sp. sptzw28]|uniref:Gfo/Idh/MocA family protein n=1 Tax=Paenibacillus sp. sptzw28 TaxID=715179 RepID=UPI001C6F33AA|nr:Gfo/Idh/MocA family oxidoreductase [Paenibacillus sp. sptzw28]QYR23488.1 Gfo/Idh/MocA family oxidoreductase [Paenibacillus sp. sptzw28]
MKLRAGMIGLGVISKFYVHALQQRLDNPVLAAVCDLSDARMVPFTEDGLPGFKDYKELLKRDDIDAVIVNVPNDKHFEICRDALLAGKHVCCEKPMTLTLQEAEELVSVSRTTGRTMFTAFHRRYNVHFVNALEQLNSIEDIHSVSAGYLEKIEEHAGEDRWYLQPERCGGGCVADNGPNVFDTLAFFLGKMRVISADITRNERNVDIEARVKLLTGSGIPVSVHLDWAYLHGEKKDIRIHLKNGHTIEADMLAGFTAFKSSLYHEYEEILKDFTTRIKTGGCHGEDGFDAVRLVYETYQAEAIKA